MTRSQELNALEQMILDRVDEVNVGLACDAAVMSPAQIHELAQAAERVLQGSYGQCADCDEPIPLARLQAKPQAIRCVACQRRAELIPTHHPFDLRVAS